MFTIRLNQTTRNVQAHDRSAVLLLLCLMCSVLHFVFNIYAYQDVKYLVSLRWLRITEPNACCFVISCVLLILFVRGPISVGVHNFHLISLSRPHFKFQYTTAPPSRPCKNLVHGSSAGEEWPSALREFAHQCRLHARWLREATALPPSSWYASSSFSQSSVSDLTGCTQYVPSDLFAAGIGLCRRGLSEKKAYEVPRMTSFILDLLSREADAVDVGGGGESVPTVPAKEPAKRGPFDQDRCMSDWAVQCLKYYSFRSPRIK